MRRKYEKGDSVDDGFMLRPFDPNFDGWLNALADEDDYPAVQNARDVIAMFHEIQKLRRENWFLQKEVDQLAPLAYPNYKPKLKAA